MARSRVGRGRKSFREATKGESVDFVVLYSCCCLPVFKETTSVSKPLKVAFTILTTLVDPNCFLNILSFLLDLLRTVPRTIVEIEINGQSRECLLKTTRGRPYVFCQSLE